VDAVSPFEDLRDVVLRDPDLQRQLCLITDWPAFAEALLQAARRHGIGLTAPEIDEERRRQHLGWLARQA
jgi:hypothetical protein